MHWEVGACSSQKKAYRSRHPSLVAPFKAVNPVHVSFVGTHKGWPVELQDRHEMPDLVCIHVLLDIRDKDDAIHVGCREKHIQHLD